MKKYIFILIATLSFNQLMVSCEDDRLDIAPVYEDDFGSIDTEDKLQAFLNSAYLRIMNVRAYGAESLMVADILGDGMFATSYLSTFNYTYNALNNDFNAYGQMYSVILNCNIVINNDLVPMSEETYRIKSEAKILRAFAYFYLVNSYSPTPTSNQNQDYGVPLMLSDFDITVQPERATVSEIYTQIIADLESGIDGAVDTPDFKNYLSKTAGKLILSKVYLTRRAGDDVQRALNLTTDIINNSPANFAPIDALSGTVYKDYFNSQLMNLTENQDETIWELDCNFNNNSSSGIGSNISLPSYYERNGTRRSLLFTQDFYNSFGSNDVRREMFTTQNVPTTDNPTGLFTTKWTRQSEAGNYLRDIKILRYSEVILNRIEALYLLGQNSQALQELNEFALSRNGATYDGTDLLKDILDERHKEFFAEGMRFYDLKRYNLPIVRTSNCSVCNLPAGDLKFVFPISEGVLNLNSNLKQYPGY